MKREGMLLLGDVHVEKNSLYEIAEIFDEIFKIPSKIFNQLGDLCDKNRLDAEELNFLTYYMTQAVNTFDSVGIVQGNHDMTDGKSAIIDYLKHLRIRLYPDDYLNNDLLLGHWFTDKSWDAFGKDFRYTVENLKKRRFKYCLLGHQHDFQVVDEQSNIFHLGSARFVKFSERENLNKRVAWVHEDGSLEFININSVIPARTVSSVSELEKIPDRTKVRYVYKTFESLKEDVKSVEKIKGRFHQFKSKIDFKTQTNFKGQEVKKVQSKTIIEDWLCKIDDSETRNILEEEFSKEIQ